MPSTADLYAAIAADDKESVAQLLTGELSDSSAYRYTTPLLQATRLGSVELVRLLLDAGRYMVDDGDENGYTPLMAACEAGVAEIVRLLLAAGARADAQYERETESEQTGGLCREQGTPLTLAAEGGYADICALLLEHGADAEEVRFFFDGCDNYRETPLLLAVQGNRFELAALLLRHGARVDGECLYEGEPHTPLSYAVARRRRETVQWLMAHGADPDKQIDGQSVRELAEELKCGEWLG